MEYYLQVPIANMPINLVLVSDGTLAFVKVARVGVIFDQNSAEQLNAVFAEDSFQIGNALDLCYNVRYNYKEIPDMLRWLIAQNLELPEEMM